MSSVSVERFSVLKPSIKHLCPCGDAKPANPHSRTLTRTSSSLLLREIGVKWYIHIKQTEKSFKFNQSVTFKIASPWESFKMFTVKYFKEMLNRALKTSEDQQICMLSAVGSSGFWRQWKSTSMFSSALWGVCVFPVTLTGLSPSPLLH